MLSELNKFHELLESSNWSLLKLKNDESKNTIKNSPDKNSKGYSKVLDRSLEAEIKKLYSPIDIKYVN